MEFKIAVLAGDGIGPEISVQGVDVMTAVCEKFGHKVSYEYALCGAHAIDEVGDPFPEKTYEVCKQADAVLFSAVGDPKFDNDPKAKDCWLCEKNWDYLQISVRYRLSNACCINLLCVQNWLKGLTFFASVS